MTYEFEYLMHLFSCGARGLTPMPPRQAIDFDRLVQLAYEQSVLPLVGIALGRATQMGFPNDKVQPVVTRSRNLALLNYIKRGQILNLLQEFEKAGIRAVLLKGYTLADLYVEPNCRISADTDIYINIKDEKKACKLLSTQGCKVNPRSPTSHHAECEHSQMGNIELHVILYDEFIEDIWFGKLSDRQFIQEAFDKRITEDGPYFILGKTDHMIFLALHMIKHFILSGTSLRQMMDIALYFKEYRFQIDIKRFWSILEALKYRKLINTILNAMILYCGFSSEDFIGFEIQEEEATSALLTDLEDGGWLGIKEKNERNDSWYRYNRIKFAEKRTAAYYLAYMMKRTVISNVHAIFPAREVMAKKFPYVKKTVCLIPIAWTHRFFKSIWRLIRGKMDTGIVLRSKQVSSDDKGRDYLFKLMNMM